MLLDNGDGTYMAGPLDVICILQDEDTGRFHAAFFEEHPLPGPVESVEETSTVRLFSRMHHTGGADTLEGAKAHFQQLRNTIQIEDANVSDEPISWDGQLGIVWMFPNWKRRGQTFGDMFPRPDPKPSQEERGQLTFAPGVAQALLGTKQEEARAQREGYIHFLGEMDLATSSLGHQLLVDRGIDHAHPAGYLAFKTEEEKWHAAKLLHNADPKRFGDKWRGVRVKQ